MENSKDNPKRTRGPEIPQIRIPPEFILEQKKKLLEALGIIEDQLTPHQQKYIDTLFSTKSEKTITRSANLLQKCIRDYNFMNHQIVLIQCSGFYTFNGVFPETMIVDNIDDRVVVKFINKDKFNAWRDQLILDYHKINDIKINHEVETKPDLKMVPLLVTAFVALVIGSYAASKVGFSQGTNVNTKPAVVEKIND